MLKISYTMNLLISDRVVKAAKLKERKESDVRELRKRKARTAEASSVVDTASSCLKYSIIRISHRRQLLQKMQQSNIAPLPASVRPFVR